MKNPRSELSATPEPKTAAGEAAPAASPAKPAAKGPASPGVKAAGDAPGADGPARGVIGNWPDPM